MKGHPSKLASLQPSLQASKLCFWRLLLCPAWIQLSCLFPSLHSSVRTEWMSPPLIPRIQLKLPGLPGDLTWQRLAAPFLSPLAVVDAHFKAIHSILPTRERLHRTRQVPSSACLHCPVPIEDGLHFFTTCRRVAAAWDYLLHQAIMVLGLALTNQFSFVSGLASCT